MFIIWSALSWFIAISSFAFMFLYSSAKLQWVFGSIGISQILLWLLIWRFSRSDKNGSD